MHTTNQNYKMKRTKSEKNEHQKSCRINNPEHYKNIDFKCYYKRKGMSDLDIQRYGEFAPYFFKIKEIIKGLEIQNAPDDMLEPLRVALL